MRRRLTGMLLVLAAVAAGCSPTRPDPCDASPYLEPVPLAEAPDGQLASIMGGRTRTATGGMLYLRIAWRGPVPAHNVFADVDADRMTGMWSYQSPISAAGWDVFVDGDGRALRHASWPNTWEWRPLETTGYGRSVGQDFVDLCVPLSASSTERPVRVAVMHGADTWFPAPFHRGVVHPREEAPPPPGPAPVGRLAINYSATPWVVRGCHQDAAISCAADVYGRFDDVVLTSGLEQPGHPSHEQAAQLIGAVRALHPEVVVWGYVSMIGGPPGPDGRRKATYSPADILERSRLWQAIGATGIFLDESDLCSPVWQDCPISAAGEEMDLDRRRQTAVVAGIHALGMPVFVNAFSVHDALAPRDGLDTPLGGGDGVRPSDVYLFENPSVSSGRPPEGLDAKVSEAKFGDAWPLASARGVRLAAIDTFDGAVPDAADLDPRYSNAFSRAAAAGITRYGFTNFSYSSLPEHASNLAILRAPR